MGYSFADTVTAEEKSDICQLLARWAARSGDERERAETSASAKAPGGEVVFFSGVVPYVHTSRTDHLWVPANVPPPPAEASPRQGTVGVGIGKHEHGTNPWRGKTVEAETFQQIDNDRVDLSSQTNEEVGGKRRGAGVGEAAKYVVDDSTPRNRRGKSSASEETEGELAERESRMASEPGPRTRTKPCRKHQAGGRGRSRRRGLSDQTDSLGGQGDDPAERPRVQSEATESDTRGVKEHSAITRLQEKASDLPTKQHRKLRPLAMKPQNNSGAREGPEAGVNAAGGDPAAIVTPSAPSKIKSSKSMNTYW